MTQTRVGAFKGSPQTDNSASQSTPRVSFTPFLKCRTNYLVAMTSCSHMSPTKACFGFFPKDFSTCPPPTGKTCKALVDAVLVTFQSCALFGFPVFAAPPVLHEYLLSVELNVSDAAAFTQLKTALNGSAYPIGLNGSIQVSGINFTTGTGRPRGTNKRKGVLSSKQKTKEHQPIKLNAVSSLILPISSLLWERGWFPVQV